jgi:hypothetical protein
MSLKTTLKCPHCENIGHTTRRIRTGAKVRCSRCHRDFPFAPLESGENHPEEELCTIGDSELRDLSEFFSPEEQRAPVFTGDNLNRGRTEKPFTRHPLAPASARSKDALIGGKPLRFHGSRQFMAYVGVIALAGLGYICFVGLHGTVRETEAVSKTSIATKKEIYADTNGPRSKTAVNPKSIVIPPPRSVAVGPRTPAGTPSRIGGIEVCVVRVFEGILNPSQTDERLAITLSITNLSKRPFRYHCWSDPENKLSLRDQTPSSTSHPLVEPAAGAEVTLQPEATVEDTLVFSPTPRLYGLNLDLPLRDSFETFRFQIPREFIERTR